MVWGSKWKGKWCNCNIKNTINSKKELKGRRLHFFFLPERRQNKSETYVPNYALIDFQFSVMVYCPFNVSEKSTKMFSLCISRIIPNFQLGRPKGTVIKNHLIVLKYHSIGNIHRLKLIFQWERSEGQILVLEASSEIIQMVHLSRKTRFWFIQKIGHGILTPSYQYTCILFPLQFSLILFPNSVSFNSYLPCG